LRIKPPEKKASGCAGAHGGALAGSPRQARILAITTGSSRSGNDPEFAAALRAVFEVNVEHAP